MNDEQVREIIKETGIHIYRGGFEEDNELMSLWVKLHTTGDINTFFMRGTTKSIGEFFGTLRTSPIVCYAYRDDGIWALAFIEQLSEKVVYLSLWVDKSMRSSKKALAFSQVVFTMTLDSFSTVLSLTRRELVDEFRKVGYDVIGPAQDFAEPGNTVWFMILTKKQFEESKLNLNRGEST